MSCIHCDRRQAQIERLKDELSAWKAYAESLDGSTSAGEVDAADLVRWRQALPEARGGALKVLMVLSGRPGRVYGKMQLLAAMRTGDSREVDDPLPQTATVQVSKAREALRSIARADRLPFRFRTLQAGIVTHEGLGWSMPTENAQQVRALLEAVA